jgi:acetyltransferase-like isoleucine patch superfamily enzyme
MNEIVKKIVFRLVFLFDYYFIHHANPISYLRRQGAVIGKDCDILCGVWGFGTEPYLIHIGDNVTLAGGVMLVTHDGATRVYRSSDSRWKPGTGLYGKIKIGNNVFIGTNALVLPGVEIGDNVVIGAGSVVTKAVPSNQVVAGNPAKMISTVDEYREKSLGKSIFIERVANKKMKKIELIKSFWS